MENTVNTTNKTTTSGSISSFYQSVDRIKSNNGIIGECNLGLGWHKFLIYFGLWVTAITNIITGVTTLGTAFTYADRMSGVGAMLLYALGCIFLGIFAIVVRCELANFSRNAPKHLITMQVISLVATIAVGLFGGADLAASWPAIVGSIVGICINNTYYNNRAAMFTRG